MGGSSCASPLPVLEQMGVGRAPPLGFVPLLPLAVAGAAGFGRAGKSGAGTELLLTLPPRPPSPHTRPDTWSLVWWYPGCGVWFWGVFLVLVIISLTLGVRVRLRRPCDGPAPPPKAISPSFSQAGPSRGKAVPLLPDSAAQMRRGDRTYPFLMNEKHSGPEKGLVPESESETNNPTA